MTADTDREARLEEIRERRQGITGTEWFRWTSAGDVSRVYRDGSDGMFLQHTHTYETDEGFTRATEEANRDLGFIAHAPEDIDWLLSEIDRLRKIEEAARVVERKVGREAKALMDLGDHIEAGEGDASEIRVHEGGLIHAREILRRALDRETP